MKTFLGMEVEQSGKTIKFHLDCYVQQVLAEYKAYIKKMMRPKKVLISPGVILNSEDVPELQSLQDQRKQKHYQSFLAKLQFVGTWVLIDIAFTVSQQARFRFRNGQRCTTSWNIWKATRASRLHIGEVTDNQTCCLGT